MPSEIKLLPLVIALRISFGDSASVECSLILVLVGGAGVLCPFPLCAAFVGPFEEFWAELEALVAALDCGWARFLFISKLGCGWARCLLAQCVFLFGYRLGLGVSGSCCLLGL
ncbi:hypothetical protein OIU76_000596 [Salix suchowensis]|nr:hypothetical protein OIU76_000596 [Salix suchowensis]